MTGSRTAAAAVAALVLAGCGAEPAADGLARWRAKADRICDRTERALRDEPPARSVSDLEHVMVRAGDHLLAAVDDIRALPVPRRSRAKVARVLDDLELVVRNVRRVRRATRTRAALTISLAARSLRRDASRFARTARRAGLERCGRKAPGHAAADAVAMPSYAAGIAEQSRVLMKQFRRLRVDLDESGTTGERIWLWKQMSVIVESIDAASPNETPRRIEQLDNAFSYWLYDLAPLADEVAYLMERGDLATARKKAAAAFRMAARIGRRGIEILEATGAPGRELLPAVRREARR